LAPKDRFIKSFRYIIGILSDKIMAFQEPK